MAEKSEEKNESGEFFLNKATLEIHHLPHRQPQCKVDEIKSGIQFLSLAAARSLKGADLCAYCFKSEA